jgi:hypothetical protein
MIEITVVVGAFGSGDTPPCAKCGAPARLTGRETHPDLGAEYELQTFECGKCGHIQSRSADEQGKPALST